MTTYSDSIYMDGYNANISAENKAADLDKTGNTMRHPGPVPYQTIREMQLFGPFPITHLDHDPCPVCGSALHDQQTLYCSARCRTAAYNFRKRTLYERRFLHQLGFQFKFTDGVQVTIYMPDEMWRYYPTSLRQWHWLIDPDLLDATNAADFWQSFTRQLGPVVGPFLAWLYSRPHIHLDDNVMWRDSILRVAHLDDYSHFHCPKCNEDYIRSEVSQDTPTGLCADCATEAIPF
jgi:predicted RNA-binding Zn-ribbon protein involved in translation (DUF1610 family)/predicted nucleic acid-binding Zn ribbon protein